MSMKRHHADWLSLIEVSGPFLTLPVLERVFPQGLDTHDPEHFRRLKLAYDEWEESQDARRPNPAMHHAWITFVLTHTLGLPADVIAAGQSIPQTLKAMISEHGETLRPDIIVRNPAGVPQSGKIRLLIQTYPLNQHLEKSIPGKHWKASPATRMMELLHATDVRLGLVTNGEHWMLVDAPRGETTGFASWYASLWLEEPVTLRAFRSLLGVSRFFSVPDDETLEAMFAESATHQQEVTDQLGFQVRRAVEVLMQSLDRADQDHGRELLANVPETVLYEAALTVMMRLVFLFSAEERDLLLLGDPLYDQHYAVSTLVAQLQETADQHGEEVLERRLDAWVRLLSTFRAVYAGVQHERMKLPAYGGNLFYPDRFPFLEGRMPGTSWQDTLANPLPVNNRTVLHLLRSLQYLEMQGEAQRLSFRALDIEQIGHVYEGLLDHTAKRATEPVLGLRGTKEKEPEIPLAELEQHQAKSKDELLNWLKDETGRSVSALRRALEPSLGTYDANKLRAVCGNDEALFQRVRPFAGLLRSDTFDRPVVIRQGSVYVTAGTDRRASGTHYTPRSLTEPIVQYTLEPLVYMGPAEGTPKEEWKLRSARELLDLKICDMACGSGAFLVQACRYLSELLVEAWEQAEIQPEEEEVQVPRMYEPTAELSGLAAEHPPSYRKNPAPTGAASPVQRARIIPFGKPARGKIDEQIIPADPDERMAYARRIIAQRCLYGVDKNPLAVEMAKLSLWLLTLAKDKPFTFLDHAIRSGDSLVGIKDLEQLRVFNLNPETGERGLFTGPTFDLVDEAVALRKKIEANPSNTVEDVEAQKKLLAEAEEKTARLRYAADFLLSVEFQPVSSKEKEDLHNSMAIQAGHYVSHGTIEEFQAVAKKAMSGQPTFHWPLEFPEVMLDRGGFDAFMGNPPYKHGSRISTTFGANYLHYLLLTFSATTGKADLCTFFVRQAFDNIASHGRVGLVVTNSIAEGQTLQSGLNQIVKQGGLIYRTTTDRRWPGEASVFVNELFLTKQHDNIKMFLNDRLVPGISARLSSELQIGDPYELLKNTSLCFKGSELLGNFFLSEEERIELFRHGEQYRTVCRPFIGGKSFTSAKEISPDRFVMFLGDLSLEDAKDKFPAAVQLLEARFFGPQSDQVAVPKRREWWQFHRPRTVLYKAMKTLQFVLVRPNTSNMAWFEIGSSSWVYSPTTSFGSRSFTFLCLRLCPLSFLAHP